MNDNLRLDSRYLDWLCDLVGAVPRRNKPESSYILLCAQLFQTRFEGWLPNDDSREMDGKDLREEFLKEKRTTSDHEWRSEDCSFLEMLIALARRVADQIGGQPSECFWLLISNLELDKYTDDRFGGVTESAIAWVLETVNDRTYERDGRGGLFPLNNPPFDQRKVEIWDQMSTYLVENYEF